MENEKVKYLIDMINEMDIKNKLRLAICMSKSEWSGLIYNSKENYEKFDSMLKSIDEEYRNTLINFGKYKLVMFAMAKLMEIDGNHRNLKVRSEYSKLTPEIITKIDSRFQQEFKAALDILRLHSADVLGVGNQFFKENRAQYKSFVKNLEREDDFINHVIFKLNFTIEPN